MRFTLQFPMRAVARYGTWVGDGHLADVAALAEEAGFDAVAMTDHPFPEDAWLAAGGHHAFDPFVALSFMGAATRRVRLLTNVLVAPYRNPYLAAKAIGSLDVLSGGRAVVGLAAGYLRAEFAAVGADFDGRGGRVDAAVRAMRAAWTGTSVDHDDPHFGVHGHTMLPAPLQRPGPPIWIGGNSGRARRRAVELGDGWMPFPAPPPLARITGTAVLDSLDRLAALVAGVQERRAAAGAAPLDVAFVPFEDQRDVAAGAPAL
ncbi:MAG TPA: TIGR03619 family F420-dependent LLM class oxidoreductase, partial [Acidimicrobiales bacterium]